ncbi:MAG: hypothetical protein MUF15_13645 [Acidobacteria bacterium]|jgi:hypothetical protein|nr:hypothetical protein [Acidobacteriota bacterium]
MEHIKVINKARMPVNFTAFGHNARLGPGESIELPEYCREAPELKKLCLREYISIISEKKEGPGTGRHNQRNRLKVESDIPIETNDLKVEIIEKENKKFKKKTMPGINGTSGSEKPIEEVIK